MPIMRILTTDQLIASIRAVSVSVTLGARKDTLAITTHKQVWWTADIGGWPLCSLGICTTNTRWQVTLWVILSGVFVSGEKDQTTMGTFSCYTNLQEVLFTFRRHYSHAIDLSTKIPVVIPISPIKLWLQVTYVHVSQHRKAIYLQVIVLYGQVELSEQQRPRPVLSNLKVVSSQDSQMIHQVSYILVFGSFIHSPVVSGIPYCVRAYLARRRTFILENRD